MADEYIKREDAFELLDGIYDCNDMVFEKNDSCVGLDCGSCRWRDTKNYIRDRLSRIPAADVRPVVLCCNCEHYKTFGCGIGCGWCDAADRSTYDDFFCASGRWKSNSADMREVQDG